MKRDIKKISFSCPVCGRKTDRLPNEMVEGAVIRCPFCNLSLRLHGHMWQEVQKAKKELEENSDSGKEQKGKIG